MKPRPTGSPSRPPAIQPARAASSSASRPRTSPHRHRPRGRTFSSGRTRRSISASPWPKPGECSALVARGLGKVPDPFAARPLRPRVLHRVHQLAHEAGRHVDARDDGTGHVALVDLVLDAGERDGELVVGEADVGEVRVDAGEVLGVEVEVQLAVVGLRLHAPYDNAMSASTALERLAAELGRVVGAPVELERPADPAHGDYATNAALRLAPERRRPPRELAEAIATGACGL